MNYKPLLKTTQVGMLWSFYTWYKESSIVIIVWVEIKYAFLDIEFIIVITISNYNNF